MWKLYKLLEHGISKTINRPLIEESSNIIQNIPIDNFRESLVIMYGESYYKNRKSMTVGIMFIMGLQKLEFFKFVRFVRNLSNG